MSNKYQTPECEILESQLEENMLISGVGGNTENFDNLDDLNW